MYIVDLFSLFCSYYWSSHPSFTMTSVTGAFTTQMTTATDPVTTRDERYTTKGGCQICSVITISIPIQYLFLNSHLVSPFLKGRVIITVFDYLTS